MGSLTSCGPNAQPGLTPDEARAIAKDAYIYGFPVVDNYRVQYAYFVDRDNPEFKAPWNQIRNTPRVYTSEDKAVQAPNSDTPYSHAGLDLRAEPVVLTVPVIDTSLYFSVQLIDAYTHNFAYIGSRSTGNEGGSFLMAGPGWEGVKPNGVTAVIRSETNFVLAWYRTQLFASSDLENVKNIQAGYLVQPLSEFLGTPAPAIAPKIDFLKPLSREEQNTAPEFFNVLNFALQLCPTHPSEEELMDLSILKRDLGKSEKRSMLAGEYARSALKRGLELDPTGHTLGHTVRLLAGEESPIRPGSGRSRPCRGRCLAPPGAPPRRIGYAADGVRRFDDHTETC